MRKLYGLVLIAPAVIPLVFSLGCSSNATQTASPDLEESVRAAIARAMAVDPDESYVPEFQTIYDLDPEALGVCAVIAMTSEDQIKKKIAVDVLQFSSNVDVAVPLLSSVIQYGDVSTAAHAYFGIGGSLSDTKKIAAHGYIFSIAIDDVRARPYTRYPAMYYISAYGGDRATSALRSFAEDRSLDTTLRIDAIVYGYEMGGLAEVTQWDIDWIAIADHRNGTVRGRDYPVIKEILDFLSIE